MLWKRRLPEKSLWANRMEDFLILLALAAALWTGLSKLSVEPSLRQPQGLTPRMSGPERTPEDDGDAYTLDDRSGLFEVRGKNVVFQPLGLNVPLSVCRTARGLMVSAVIRDIDGKEVAKIINNRWLEFPKRPLRRNFDASGIEVFDENGIAIFQIDYVDARTIRFGGVFQTEFGKCSEVYNDFPSASGPPFAMNWTAGGILFVRGAHGAVVLRTPETKREHEELRATAKRFIKPFFDYTHPGKLGVRNAANEGVPLMHVSLTDEDRTKYEHLTNAELKECALTFVGGLRGFADRVMREEMPMDQDMQDMDRFQKALADANSGPKVLSLMEESPVLNRMQDQMQKQQTEYAQRYRVTALVLRTELRSRLPEGDKASEALIWYEHPTNSFGYLKVADDLEKLATRLL